MSNAPRAPSISKWWLKGDPGFNPQTTNLRCRDGTHSSAEERGVGFKIVEEINKGCSGLQFDCREFGFPCVEILHNCDLPPPVKVFTGEKEWNPTSFLSLSPLDYSDQNSRLLPSKRSIGTEEEDLTQDYRHAKLGLLKALQLSQTRAREAEKKASLLIAEKDNLLGLFFNQSSQLFAYKQWVKLLEIQISKLQPQSHVIPLGSIFHTTPTSTEKQNVMEKKKKKKEIDGGVSKWCVALCVCLGFASVGFVLGWSSQSICRFAEEL